MLLGCLAVCHFWHEHLAVRDADSDFWSGCGGWKYLLDQKHVAPCLLGGVVLRSELWNSCTGLLWSLSISQSGLILRWMKPSSNDHSRLASLRIDHSHSNRDYVNTSDLKEDNLGSACRARVDVPSEG